MRANAVILIVIGLLLLVGTAAAVIQVNVNGNASWLVAGSGSSAAYTVTVTNTSGSVPIDGASITFSVDPLYGTMSPTTVTTDSAGHASSTFTVNTKSGTAPIIASIIYMGSNGPFSMTQTIPQNIDHASPYYVQFTHPNIGEVTSEVPFNLSITDRFGNKIDNRTGNHIITLLTSGPAPQDGGFNYSGGYPSSISPSLDSNGNFSVNLKLTSKIGTNYIVMAPLGSINPQKTESILAVTTGKPYSMTTSISNGGILPNAWELPVSSTYFFRINYVFYDKYGNPTGNRSAWVNTSLSGSDEQQFVTSNSLGQVQVKYGPKTSVQTVTITSISIDNQSVNNVSVVKFINTDPTNMVLAVTPMTMASRDLVSTEKAFVRATVIDEFGNPVQGELVTFSLGSPSGTTLKVQPVLDNTTAQGTSVTSITDKDRNAIVLFYPGSFKNWTETGYDPKSKGQVDVHANWKITSRTVTATWMNYPYLSISTSASNSSLVLNDTVDITIDVIGNGYKMGGGQVTAILDLDCTSNMFSNKDPPYASRADSAKAAADGFAIEMLDGNQGNWIGLSSFGTEKNDKFHLPPQTSLTVVQTKIQNLVKGTNAGDFGPSITEAMVNITDPSLRPPDKIRAVVILNDGGSNINNQGEMDAIVAYANSQNPPIQLFTVLYYDGTTSTAKAYTQLKELADRTTPPGHPPQFFHSKNPAELAQAFIDIAQILKTSAGVNAQMDLDFQQVQVNSEPMNGGDVFSYVPVPDPTISGGFSDLVPTPPTSRDSILGRTRIMWPNSSFSVKNQSDEWNANQQLHFDIGTVNISQQWNTTYRLKVNQTGLIDIFNCTVSPSSLSFEDENGIVQEPMCLPNLFITVTDNSIPVGLQSGIVDVSNLKVTKSGNITDFIPLSWNLKYSGASSVTETLSYSFNDGPWITYSTNSGIPPSPLIGYSHTAQIDVKKFPPGGYKVKVHAIAPDGEDSEETITITLNNYGVFIKLE